MSEEVMLNKDTTTAQVKPVQQRNSNEPVQQLNLLMIDGFENSRRKLVF